MKGTMIDRIGFWIVYYDTIPECHALHRSATNRTPAKHGKLYKDCFVLSLGKLRGRSLNPKP